MTNSLSMSQTLPVIPMRATVLFPGVSLPIAAGRPQTLRAIEAALRDPERRVFAVAQNDDGEDIKADDLYTIGTIATLGAVQRGQGGVLRIVLEGQKRAIAKRVTTEDGHLVAVVADAADLEPLDPKSPTFQALNREVRDRSAELASKRGVPGEAVEQMLQQITEPGRLSDLVAGYLDIGVGERQALLEMLAIEDRLRGVLIHVQRQLSVLTAQADIQSKVKEELGGR